MASSGAPVAALFPFLYSPHVAEGGGGWVPGQSPSKAEGEGSPSDITTPAKAKTPTLPFVSAALRLSA